MRVCVLSAYDGRLDEGMANVGFHLARQLSRRHQVRHLNVRGLATRQFWRDLRQADPDVLHYTHGPSPVGLALMRALRLLCKGSRTVVSATQPRMGGLPRMVAPLLRPDLVLAQSAGSARLFQGLGYNAHVLPNGVDTERFRPLPPGARDQLRDRYGLERHSYVLLHVGPLGARRNLGVLERAQQQEGVQVVVAASPTAAADANTWRRLEAAGCLVWRRYLECVEELYALADCYLFPALDPLGSVETPLSVLEAMSCNLPVVTTPFGGLPELFTEGGGLHYAHDTEGLLAALARVRAARQEPHTREKVMPCSWEEVVSRVERLYGSLALRRSHAV